MNKRQTNTQARKKEKRRAIWMTSSLVVPVILGLFIGISYMPPKLHPIFSLRGKGDEVQAPPPRAIQGVPLGAAKTTLVEPKTATEPPPAESSTGDEYQWVTFDLLTNYQIEEPDWNRMDDLKYANSLVLDEYIPDRVKALSGKKVEVQGFMLPIDVKDGKVLRFMLLKDQMACCFGAIPRLNEWIYVKVPERLRTDSQRDVPITLLGTMSVGAKFEHGMLAGIYYLELDRMYVE